MIGGAPSSKRTSSEVDFLEDETVMNSASSEPTPRTKDESPAIADVGFNRRVAPDREETPVSSLAQPWEEIVEKASKRPSKQTSPTAIPMLEKKRAPDVRKPTARETVPPTRKSPRTTLPPPAQPSSLDADTDEGVVQVPPDPDQFASLQPMQKRPRTDLPAFGAEGTSWPSGATKPVASPLKRPLPEKRKSDLLENKPVTGAKYPAKPVNEETRHGKLVSSGSQQGGQTIAAPGELAGLLDGPLPPRAAPSRPELVDDLLSSAAIQREQREQRRAEMRKSIETTSPEELRRMRAASKPHREGSDIEDTNEVLDTNRLEETRAFAENPLARPAGMVDSGMLPLPKVAPDAPREARPFGETQVILRLASGKRRLLALVIDAVVVIALVAIPVLLGVFGDAVSSANWLDPDDVSLLLTKGMLTLPLALFVGLILIFSMLGHGLTGRSLGKLICGLEVVRKKNGVRTGFVRAAIRAFLGVFSLLLGGAGYLWLIVDRRARTFHDYLTGTIVVVASSRTEGSRAESFVHEPTL